MKALMTLVLALLVAGWLPGETMALARPPRKKNLPPMPQKRPPSSKRKLPSSLPQNHRIARSPMADEK